ncbi:MAG: FAD-dependent oxidoreductase [Actinomycetota bacterium]|nr:FAD-dependent oxidoreductase [Actinomycetota bacterium]
MAIRLVIIGGVAAGTKAASRARRVDPDLEITIYQEEPEISQSECGLPYLISGVVGDRDDLVARTPEKFAEKDVEVFIRHRVEKMDPEQKKLVVRNLTTGEEFEDSYDRLIIATGARSVLLPIDGADLDGVFSLRFLTDTDKICGFVKERSAKKAAIIGGGYIGLEMAENLVELGMEVSLYEAMERVGGIYSPEVSEKIKEQLEENGVRIFTDAQIEAFVGDEDGRIRAVRFADEEVETELVIVAVGAEPEVTLAEEAGAKIGPSNAIQVDKHLKTSLPDVWAAGDCVESVHLVSGEPGWEPLGDTANQMGRVAGTNAGRGEDVLEFSGILNTGVFKVFDIAVAKTGLSEKEAEEAGFEVVAASVESVSKAGYYPGGQSAFIKLVADQATGRLLGAETVGGNADKYVDICATAIWGKLSYPDLVNLDLAYAPPFGPALSPVIAAASVLANEFEKETEGVRALE